MSDNQNLRAAFRADKRRTLGKLAALSLFPWVLDTLAFADDSGGPRVALVIGNGAYPGAPLRNPPNDANAIAATLKQLNFEVDLKTDCTRDAMINSIRGFCDRVERNSAVALFYFAGHGMQIDWRNYLLPVDIRLAAAGDVPQQTVDSSALVGSLGKLSNPMNIVILDACRNNPFGFAGSTGAGLSQMDAPTRTFLAYATAPGNVASDGSGKNGLYTENLLREMVRPDAKIEDVFKRVRLAVRLQSHGRQIPWESTSLEGDFYFIPPPTSDKPTDEQLDQLAQADKDDWDAAQQAGTADAIAAYLKTHPNGNFCELAQAALDRLLAASGEQKVVVKTDQANPFTQGSAVAATMKLGERYTYREIDLYSKRENWSSHQQVTKIDDTSVEFDNGRFRTDLLGNTRVDSKGTRYSDRQLFVSDYMIGKEWKTRYDRVLVSGKEDTFEYDFRVVSRESITVPAGTFDAFCVKGEGWRLESHSRLTLVYWIAPDKVPRYLAMEFAYYGRGRGARDYWRQELVSFDAA
ncbi:caspase family protein [Paraburkholderia acidipaludis]|uniref:caspase family protein n=1 Tax=Paraburkholderia acidipaludis TaxID=660537 RepID=UPI000693DDA8|nr:caspase family protein [Paraburkholderia acidipaludis]